MRFSLSRTLLLVALAACSSKAASSAPADSADASGADDGSTANCTSVGGTCEPFSAGSCPILQQNAELCGDVLLVCCLPPGGETVVGPDSGLGADASMPDQGTDAGPAMGEDAGPTGEDAGPTGEDAGPTGPPPDAGTRMDAAAPPPADADTSMDARTD
jgi:hypothetical protein